MKTLIIILLDFFFLRLQLLAEVAKYEEAVQKTKDEEKQKKIDYNNSVLLSLAEQLKLKSNDA